MSSFLFAPKCLSQLIIKEIGQFEMCDAGYKSRHSMIFTPANPSQAPYESTSSHQCSGLLARKSKGVPKGTPFSCCAKPFALSGAKRKLLERVQNFCANLMVIFLMACRSRIHFKSFALTIVNITKKNQLTKYENYIKLKAIRGV